MIQVYSRSVTENRLLDRVSITRAAQALKTQGLLQLFRRVDPRPNGIRCGREDQALPFPSNTDLVHRTAPLRRDTKVPRRADLGNR